MQLGSDNHHVWPNAHNGYLHVDLSKRDEIYFYLPCLLINSPKNKVMEKLISAITTYLCSGLKSCIATLINSAKITPHKIEMYALPTLLTANASNMDANSGAINTAHTKYTSITKLKIGTKKYARAKLTAGKHSIPSLIAHNSPTSP